MSAPVATRRRLAALSSITFSLALVLVAVTLLFRHGVELILGLIGLSTAVGGTWLAITETTRLRRVLGITGIVLGLFVVAAAIYRALSDGDVIFLWIATFFVLIAATFTSARAALRSDLRHELDIRVRSAGPPQKAVLLCNPKSGGGKVGQFGLLDVAKQLGVEAIVLEAGQELEQLARDAVARGADCLGMAGGDGSQALVASIAIEHRLPFVCVSAGTRNHFALDLGLNRDDPRESMLAFRDAVERYVDYATVNDRLFVNNVSLGVYAQIVQQDSYRDAKVGTTLTLLPEMLSHQAEPFDLQFTTPDDENIDGAIIVMVSNNPYVLGLTPDNAQRRRVDTGRLGIFAVTTSTGSEAAALFAATASGQRNRSRHWHEFTAATFEVASRSGTAFAGVDGEALQLPTPLQFRIHPRGLKLLVPESNIKAAERRAARAVGFRDLVAVATGHDPDQSTPPSRDR
jgi:diacylglycerol kinase family enzyme